MGAHLLSQTVESITQSFTKLREEEKKYFDDIFHIFIGLVENRHTEAQVMPVCECGECEYVCTRPCA